MACSRFSCAAWCTKMNKAFVSSSKSPLGAPNRSKAFVASLRCSYATQHTRINNFVRQPAHQTQQGFSGLHKIFIRRSSHQSQQGLCGLLRIFLRPLAQQNGQGFCVFFKIFVHQSVHQTLASLLFCGFLKIFVRQSEHQNGEGIYVFFKIFVRQLMQQTPARLSWPNQEFHAARHTPKSTMFLCVPEDLGAARAAIGTADTGRAFVGWSRFSCAARPSFHVPHGA